MLLTHNATRAHGSAAYNRLSYQGMRRNLSTQCTTFLGLTSETMECGLFLAPPALGRHVIWRPFLAVALGARARSTSGAVFTSSALSWVNFRFQTVGERGFKFKKIFSEFGGIRTVVSCVLVQCYDHYTSFCWTFSTWRLCYLSGVVVQQHSYLGPMEPKHDNCGQSEVRNYKFKLDNIATRYVPGPTGCTGKIRFLKLFFFTYLFTYLPRSH